MQLAWVRGCGKMEVSTERFNQAAQAFYRRLGFGHEAVFMEVEFDS